MHRLIFVFSMALILGGCGTDRRYDSDAAVRRALHVDDAPPSITLFTMINNRSGQGAHTGLMINGSHRVMYDPAGTWFHRTAPEQGDLHYGITDQLLSFYIDYHARETYHVVIQEVPVSRQVADAAIRAFAAAGAAPKATCSITTTRVLRTIPGFENVRVSWFPGQVRRSFARLPGVRERKVFDDDSDDNSAVLAAQGG